jgi:hypothetical protein
MLEYLTAALALSNTPYLLLTLPKSIFCKCYLYLFLSSSTEQVPILQDSIEGCACVCAGVTSKTLTAGIALKILKVNFSFFFY